MAFVKRDKTRDEMVGIDVSLCMLYSSNVWTSMPLYSIEIRVLF